ncbi:Protein CBG04926 [Caenorhabditis briggsae]|uniref:Protein CBG04923 n=1 Tax=Caenorhabditis briggsae TaxID=6238 RepID=G2J6G9_CAEBR|nr:Protein CBG04923 [Caenorhabditis briggsae]XP_002638086.1 Protein CBG04926 [Caenorhabditis briggsae]CAP25542.1 Protein CBG04923 [Caenorhabditis briggsae]CAP25545.1 Protein CBG04926 [Caenorhabditis briggsae]
MEENGGFNHRHTTLYGIAHSNGRTHTHIISIRSLLRKRMTSKCRSKKRLGQKLTSRQVEPVNYEDGPEDSTLATNKDEEEELFDFG